MTAAAAAAGPVPPVQVALLPAGWLPAAALAAAAGPSHAQQVLLLLADHPPAAALAACPAAAQQLLALMCPVQVAVLHPQRCMRPSLPMAAAQHGWQLLLQMALPHPALQPAAAPALQQQHRPLLLLLLLLRTNQGQLAVVQRQQQAPHLLLLLLQVTPHQGQLQQQQLMVLEPRWVLPRLPGRPQLLLPLLLSLTAHWAPDPFLQNIQALKAAVRLPAAAGQPCWAAVTPAEEAASRGGGGPCARLAGGVASQLLFQPPVEGRWDRRTLAAHLDGRLAAAHPLQEHQQASGRCPAHGLLATAHCFQPSQLGPACGCVCWLLGAHLAWC
jgi:hypothetical protein